MLWRKQSISVSSAIESFCNVLLVFFIVKYRSQSQSFDGFQYILFYSLALIHAQQ